MTGPTNMAEALAEREALMELVKRQQYTSGGLAVLGDVETALGRLWGDTMDLMDGARTPLQAAHAGGRAQALNELRNYLTDLRHALGADLEINIQAADELT